MPKTYSEIEAEAVEAVRLARFRGTSPVVMIDEISGWPEEGTEPLRLNSRDVPLEQPACDLHAQLRCPKRHGTTCTDEKPCINKGAPA